eukprot:1465573-Rhodomonas_salina.2
MSGQWRGMTARCSWTGQWDMTRIKRTGHLICWLPFLTFKLPRSVLGKTSVSSETSSRKCVR